MQLLGVVNQPPPPEVGLACSGNDVPFRFPSILVAGHACGGVVRTQSEHVCGCGGCGVIATSNQPATTAWQPSVS